MPDVGAAELLGAQPGQQRGEDQRQVALVPVAARRRARAASVQCLDQRTHAEWGITRGRVRAALRRPTSGIGLAASIRR